MKPATTTALVDDLISALGAESVSVEMSDRRAASTDWAHMSPILSALLPAGLADVVAYPQTPEQIATVVHLAHEHGVPLTPRGQGTGNYGQGIPLQDGLVADVSRCNRVLEVGDGWVHAEAGASFVALEAAAGRHGQELAILPSTVGSTIGGFLAGGAGGTGSVDNGFIWDGYVSALQVAPCADTPALIHVRGTDCRPHLHSYGVTGMIATATVALVPRRDWIGLLASFEDVATAACAGRELMSMDPRPRLLSIDEPAVVATLRSDTAIPLGKCSLRAVVDRSTVSAAERIVAGHGGRAEDVRGSGAAYLASLSFNHITYRVRKARPELCHLQVAGDALITRRDEVRALMPDTMVHLDGFLLDRDGEPGYAGMLLCRFEGADKLYAGIDRLRELGVQVDDPHTWLLGGDLRAVRQVAKRFDPRGLLNPGKLPVIGELREV